MSEFDSTPSESEGAAPELSPEARASAMQAVREERPVEAAPTPQAGQEPPPEGKEDGRRGNLNEALRQEREARRALERQIYELTGEVRATRQPRQPAQERPAEPLPDPYQDPTGYMLAREQSLGQTIEGLQRQLHGMTQAQQHQQVQAAVYQDYRADAERFKQEAPDFDAAYSHYLKTRNAELEAWGYSDPKQRNDVIVQEELRSAYEARRRGLSPAEVIYRMAVGRGFSAKAGSVPADPNTVAMTQAAKSLENIARAQAANRSMSGAEGTPGGEVTGEMLAKMSSEDRAEFRAKNPKRYRMLLGASN